MLKKRFFIYAVLFMFLLQISLTSYTQNEDVNLPKASFSSQPLPSKPPQKNQGTAVKIAETMDNRRSYPSAKLTGKMIVKDKYKTKTQSFVLYSRGDVDSLMRFTDGEAKNQKILRTESDIYVYFPDLAQQIRLSGASLRQSIVGSDVSYEDITSIKRTNENFEVYYLGEDTVGKYKTWVLYLLEKPNRLDKNGKRKSGEAYPVQRIWIDKVSHLAIKGEYYSTSKKLLKEVNILEYKQDGEYFIPMTMVLMDKLKKNTSTVLKFNDVNTRANISDKTFSLENLTF